MIQHKTTLHRHARRALPSTLANVIMGLGSLIVAGCFVLAYWLTAG